MTTNHTYIRCVNKIYVGDAADQWRELHSFETEKRAKRWQADQEKKRPGSVRVGSPPPQITRQKITGMQAEYERRQEIRKLAAQQARDAARSPSPRPKSTTISLSGKTAKLAGSYVAPARDESSFLRERSKKRQQSRSARNTRATYGAS